MIKLNPPYPIPYLQYCYGYSNISNNSFTLCGNVNINGQWQKPTPDLHYFRVPCQCPQCTSKELQELGIDPNELERILSLSG